ncbi:MAG TPA: TasA family protein [Candidatus Levybacteria bacterium]|nr:TasA family protein [Candidatus Levybacteria bacterium]
MLNKRIATGMMSIAGALAIAGGATFAYFTDSVESGNNKFTTGNLTVNILDQNLDTPFQFETLVSNWAPGEPTEVNFDVLNSGTLPVNLRGFALGTWGDNELDSENAVKVTKVERWNGSSWVMLGLEQPGGITGHFYYSPDGTNNELFELSPSQRAQLRLTVVLDSTADEDFESRTFTSSIHVEAKQTTTGATWPTP